MKYVCLVYFEGPDVETMSPAARAELTRESVAYNVELEKSGHLIVAQALQPVKTAATVRIRNGKSLITDGPFAETKEILGGFVMIDARDRDDAVRVAEGIPLARLGTIEVRPVLEI